jgi:transposase
VYWKPVYRLLDGGFELLVINAQHIKAVPGRKTDIKDAEWIVDLRHAWIAPGKLYSSYPSARTAEADALSVVSDITGKSAQAILDALLAGGTDPSVLADLARGRLKAKRAALEQALVGTFKAHHRFLLSEHLTHMDTLEEAIHRVGQEIEQWMQLLEQMNQGELGEPAEAAKPQTQTAGAVPGGQEESLRSARTCAGRRFYA